MNRLDKFMDIFLLLAAKKVDEEFTIEEFAGENNLEIEEVFQFLYDYQISAGKLTKVLGIDLILKGIEYIGYIDILSKKKIEENCEKMNFKKKKKFLQEVQITKEEILTRIATFQLDLKEQIKEASDLRVNQEKKRVQDRKKKLKEIEDIKIEFKESCISDIAYEIEEFINTIVDEYNYPLLLEDALEHKEIFKEITILISNGIDEKKINRVKSAIFNFSDTEKRELLRFIKANELDIEFEVDKKIVEEATLIEDIEDIKSLIEIKSSREYLELLIKFIEQKDDIDIILKSGTVMKNVRLNKIKFDVVSCNTKLQYSYRGKISEVAYNNVRLLKISDKQGTKKKKVTLTEKKEIVKFRVFHEFNAKEKAIRFAVNYDMKLEHKDEYTDFTVAISDVSKLTRFVRTLAPSAIILEPTKLRENFNKEVIKWAENYAPIGE